MMRPIKLLYITSSSAEYSIEVKKRHEPKSAPPLLPSLFSIILTGQTSQYILYLDSVVETCYLLKLYGRDPVVY